MEDNHRHLIEKFLRGTLSLPEIEDLKLWLSKDAANIEILDKLKASWQLHKGDNRQVDDALNELRTKINAGHLQAEVVKLPSHAHNVFFIKLLKVAAIFIFGFLLNQAIHSYIKPASKKNQYYTVSAGEGQKSRIVLADGTEVWLNSESKIKVTESDFTVSRSVELTGEAYFKVTKNPKVPFVVRTKAYNVEVYGTEFNIMAYDDFKRTETTLVNGMVKIRQNKQELIMKPGETVVYADKGFTVKTGRVEQAVSWKDEKFYFDAIPLSELAIRLERWYNVKIEISDTNLKNRLYSGVFKNEETIWQVLDVIGRTSPIRYERKGFRNIVISSK